MYDVTNAASLDAVDDAPENPRELVSRWLSELEISTKRDEPWMEQAREADEIYSVRCASDNRATVNVLKSNADTVGGALYSSTPKPDVRRRYRDEDPVGKDVAQLLERTLAYLTDVNDLDALMAAVVLDYLIVGRSTVRVSYVPTIGRAQNPMTGEESDILIDEAIECSRVHWEDMRYGSGREWRDVGWVGFRHWMTKADALNAFGAVAELLKYGGEEASSGVGEQEEEEENPHLYRRAEVWEIWDKESRSVIFLSKELEDRPLKVDQDPLGLRNFFPIPRPLFANLGTSILVPTTDYAIYRDQAEELNRLTDRITTLIGGLRFRGVYDATIPEMERLLDGLDNELIPSDDAAKYREMGGLAGAVTFLPMTELGNVLAGLYRQREQVKAAIYEITGISDIMRGAANANETATAQNIKSQWGSQRISARQKEVQRFVRDLFEIQAEIIAEHLTPATLGRMTGIQVTPQMEILLRKQADREYRIDIETDSTIASDIESDQRTITEMLGAVMQFMSAAAPLVQQGAITFDVAKSMLMSAVRKSKMGREVEDALDQLQPPGGPSSPSGMPQIPGGGGGHIASPGMPQQASEQLKVRAEAQKLQLEQQHASQELQLKLEIARQEIAMKERVEMAKIALQERIAQAKLAASARKRPRLGIEREYEDEGREEEEQ